MGWRVLTRAFGLALAVWLAAAGGASAGGVFSNWAGIVVAGDWHAHSGEPSEVFDNARRDLTKAFINAGFSPANISQFSVRPERYPAEAPLKSGPEQVTSRLTELTQKATCGVRPTVVVVSSCFSGVFVPALEGPNRMVLTAARPDRTSFGCGQADRYTYFDGCFLQSMSQTHDFTALALATRACVAKLEADTHVSPASEPQIVIGPQLRAMLPLYAFQPQPSHALAAARSSSTP